MRKTPYSDAYLYYLLPELTRPRTTSRWTPAWPTTGLGLADDLASADIAILSSVWNDWEEPNDSRDFGSPSPTRAGAGLLPGPDVRRRSLRAVPALQQVATRLPVRVLIVTPTYIEAENIEEFLRRARAAPDADVLVVDDNSPDGTADIAEAGRRAGQIEVLRRPTKPGWAPPTGPGSRSASSGATTSSSRSTPTCHTTRPLPTLLRSSTGADLAIGSRYVPGGSIPHWPWFRRALSRYGNRYASFVLGTESPTPPRATAPTGRHPQGHRLRQDAGEGVRLPDRDRLPRAQWGGRIVEVPIIFTDRVRGNSKMTWPIAAEELRSSPGGGAPGPPCGGASPRVAAARRVSPVLLLVVLLLDVHRPDVVVGAEDVLDREHRGEHRVVLVVVAVHAVAADRIHVRRVLVEPRARARRRSPCSRAS